MNYSNKEIAELFSNGKFEGVIDYLSDGIIWNIVGENIFKGKEAVIANCERTTAYFNAVQTDFKTNDIIGSENKIVIIGTAEFKREGKRINFVSACDVYDFNENNKIEKITSYCIVGK